jgi:peptide/nickel transport system substrate-binding protein
MRIKFGWRLLALLAVLAFVVVACTDDEGETTTTAASTTSEATTTTGAETTTTEAGATTTAPPAAGFTYRTGIFQDMTTNNFWAYLDPQSTVWNGYVLAATKPALYQIDLPGLELDTDLAASADPGIATDNGDGSWSVSVPMREDATWSDGTPITAHDIVFTAEVVRDFGLGGNWTSNYQWQQIDEATGEPVVDPGTGLPVLGLTAVDAVGDYEVKFTWNGQPGLAIWPHGPGLGSVMPMHVWEATVEEARASEDPAEVLYGADGAIDVSGGPVIFDTWEPGAFARNVANTTFYDIGREMTSGGVTYTWGPYLADQTYEIYSDQSAAVLALKAGEVDYLYNSLGLQRGLLDQITGDENLTPVINATNGFRYLAFNMRKDPMAREGFRDALALMIDKEYITGSVLQGVAYPLYATLPEGNQNWYNAEKADGYRASIVDLALDTRWDGTPFLADEADTPDDPSDDVPYTATGTEARLHAAVAALLADGFSYPEGQAPDFRDNAIVPGSGIMLDGAPVTEEITILAPGPGYDPLRATFSLFVAQALSDLGFNAQAYPTDFNVLVNEVYVPTEEGTLEFDMYMLGWSLGSPALPTYHESFFAGKNDTLVNDGNNNMGFNDPDFNTLVEDFNRATTFEEAYDIMWQMEDILFDKKPYILLFDTGIIEAYRSAAVQFPFTESLSGLQFGNGFPAFVQAAE